MRLHIMILAIWISLCHPRSIEERTASFKASRGLRRRFIFQGCSEDREQVIRAALAEVREICGHVETATAIVPMTRLNRHYIRRLDEIFSIYFTREDIQDRKRFIQARFHAIRRNAVNETDQDLKLDCTDQRRKCMEYSHRGSFRLVYATKMRNNPAQSYLTFCDEFFNLPPLEVVRWSSPVRDFLNRGTVLIAEMASLPNVFTPAATGQTVQVMFPVYREDLRYGPGWVGRLYELTFGDRLPSIEDKYLNAYFAFAIWKVFRIPERLFRPITRADERVLDVDFPYTTVGSDIYESEEPQEAEQPQPQPQHPSLQQQQQQEQEPKHQQEQQSQDPEQGTSLGKRPPRPEGDSPPPRGGPRGGDTVSR